MCFVIAIQSLIPMFFIQHYSRFEKKPHYSLIIIFKNMDSKVIKPVNPKGNQPWVLIGSTDAEAEAPILWSPDMKSQPIGKDPDAGKDWRQEEKGTTEDEMVGWHHWCNGHEFEQAPGEGEGQGAWHAAVHGIIKSWIRPDDWTTTILFTAKILLKQQLLVPFLPIPEHFFLNFNSFSW